jgi:myo-inositol-1(or 4)-monophosphatase
MTHTFAQQLDEFKQFAKLLSMESAKIIKQYFRTQIKVDSKEDSSPVTIADKKTEETMRELISKHYPAFGIIGEEFGIHNPEAEYKWILDPIDGTKSFICGAQSFGTLIALTKNDVPILGVINQPILNEFLIGDNFSTELNNSKVNVRKCERLDKAVLLTTDHLNVAKYQRADRFENLIRLVKLYRNWGDCYGYYLVATGYADIMIDPIMSLWDTAAILPIIKGAGGMVTDYSGGEPLNGNGIIASAPGIHSEIINVLNED